jgi:8-oxo-dGTP diphosphatase
MSETQIALAVIPAGFDAAGGRQYWLERRPSGVDFAGMLALPGGKVAVGETPPQALARELFEELGIIITQTTLLIEIPWVYPAVPPAAQKRLRLWVYRVDSWLPLSQNPIQGREGQAVMPVLIDGTQARAIMAQLPAANRGVVAALCLPARIAITQPCAAGDLGFEAWLAGLQTTATRLNARFDGAALIQLRPQRDLSINEWQRAVAVVQAQRVPVWVNADLATAIACGADGVHLNRARLFAVHREAVLAWQNLNRWVSASGHNGAEIDRANELGVDAVLISPVLPTPSHPDAPGMGWAEFAALMRMATMSAYALGGVGEANLAEAQGHGAQGIAAIRGYWSPN